MVYDSIDMSKKRIIVWGTGNEAEWFMRQLYLFQQVADEVELNHSWEISCFWDSNPCKTGKFFYDIPVQLPAPELLSSENDLCILAFWGWQTVVHRIPNGKLAIDRNGWITCREFLHRIRRFLAQECKEIIEKLILKQSIPLHIEYFNSLWEFSMHPPFTQICHLLRAISKARLSQNGKNILRDMLVSQILKTWESASDKMFMMQLLQETIPTPQLLSSLAFYYGQDVNSLLDNISAFPPTPIKPIKTIGIYDHRFHNGGGQKFLSLIMPIFLDMGIQIILFTDEFCPEKEYPFPAQAIRVVLGNRPEIDMSARLQEFRKAVDCFNIDLMFYNNGLFEPNFLYEILFFKWSNVFVIGEIHLMFMMVVEMGNGMAPLFYKIFRLLDHMIVLSEFDCLFWRNLGCHVSYIYNPIENGKEKMNAPIPFGQKNGNTILWVGRIGQDDKQVLDTVDIMVEVIKHCPCAKLNIVGGIWNQSVYELLIRKIMESHLQGTIEFCSYNTSIDNYYQKADIVLMTSRMEGFSFTISESKLHGIPLVLYELPYLALLQERKGYISVPQRDTRAAALGIVRLLQNSELRHTMAMEAKQSIRPFVKYDVSHHWKAVFESIGKPWKRHTDASMEIIETLLLKKIWQEN